MLLIWATPLKTVCASLPWRRARTPSFVEAPFCEADAEQAARTGHLTARACGEIAAAAGVERLAPFHFSHRYQNEADRVYAEVKAACQNGSVKIIC